MIPVKNALLITLLILSFGNTQAQVSIAPMAGLNISGYTITEHNFYGYEDLNLRNGFCGGAFVFVPIARNLDLQTGVLYKMNGFWETFHGETSFGIYNVTITQRVNSLDLPCKLMYSFKGKSGNSFFVGAGPYFAVNVASSVREKGELLERGSGKVKHIDEIYYDKIGTYESMMKRYDAGAGIMVGYQTSNGILVCLQGQRGWMDARPENLDWQAVNYNFGIIGGYTFKLKRHKAQTAEPVGKSQ